MTMKHAFSMLICTLVIGTMAMAQADLLAEANKKYREGDLKEARNLVDQAVKDPSLAQGAEVWVLRGFIYKDLYKAAAENGGDVLRDEALASLYAGIQADSTKQYAGSSKPAYFYLSKTLYNDAVHALNGLEPDRATGLFGKYREALVRLVPDTVLKGQEIEFANALGTVYVKLFNQNRQMLDRYDKAVATYKRVLSMDSTNYGANYNLATLYYNRGVYNIQRISADNDIPSLQQIQEASKEFFTQALPYMLKAHLMKPDRKETILGLEGIHYSLQDEEQSRHYRHLYEELQHDEQKEK
jgi:tetratricopeptide (TPR) repeat protein